MSDLSNANATPEGTMTPEFTIVTPSYNYGHFIRDCLESVAGQTEVTLEHLVMDAGSIDDTAQVIAEFPHATLFQEPDKGMSDAINKGFRKAKGKWVMWLNADDLLEPGALNAVREFATRHPNADVIFGTYSFIDGEGNIVRRMNLLPYSRFVSLHHGCYVPSTATFLRRDRIIDQGHLVNIKLRTVMDNEYYARLSMAGMRFVYLPKMLARFRVHSDNLSGVGGMNRAGLDAALAHAAMGVETEAIRRTYGITLFRNVMATHAVDSILYLIAWFLKGLMKLPYLFRSRPV